MNPISQKKIDIVIKNFPQEIKTLQNYIEGIRRHILSSIEGKKLEACFKHLLLCEFIEETMENLNEQIEHLEA